MNAKRSALIVSASVVGILIIPMVLVVGVVALPSIAVLSRRPWKLPIAMGTYGFVLLALVGLGLRSEYVDSHDPSIAKQLAKQKAEEQDYMRKPFEPVLSSATLAAANLALADPRAAKGKVTFNACHGDGGVGTAEAPALVGISAKYSPEQLAELFKHPTAKMTAGGMPLVNLPPDDLTALIAYVESLK